MTNPEQDARRDAASPAAPVAVAGLLLDSVDLEGAVDQIFRLADRPGLHMVVTVNVDQALNAHDDAEVGAAFRSAAMRLADGFPVVVLSRMIGCPLPARVTGADLLPAVCARAARTGHRIAIVGGAPGVTDEAARRLSTTHDGLVVAAALSPPMGFDTDADEDARIVQALVDARPDVVFVCLGSPKQELWTARRRDRLPPAVYLGVGAAVDFAAGHVPRAPQAAQRAGLEWLWRLAHDRRLARRYLVRDPRFLALAARDLRRARRPSA